MQKKFFFKKWQFFSTIIKIREASGVVDDDLKARLLSLQKDSKLEMVDPAQAMRSGIEKSMKIEKESLLLEAKVQRFVRLIETKDASLAEMADEIQAK